MDRSNAISPETPQREGKIHFEAGAEAGFAGRSVDPTQAGLRRAGSRVVPPGTQGIRAGYDFSFPGWVAERQVSQRLLEPASERTAGLVRRALVCPAVP